jgi:uncharacterized secreted protein with C-terminal beta-propeller domain
LKGKITHCTGKPLPSWSSSFDINTYRCSIERSLYIGNVLYTVSNQKIGMNDLETLAEIGEIDLT